MLKAFTPVMVLVVGAAFGVERPQHQVRDGTRGTRTKCETPHSLPLALEEHDRQSVGQDGRFSYWWPLLACFPVMG
jgi:hypothetical protein